MLYQCSILYPLSCARQATSDTIDDFLLVMSVCHTVVPETQTVWETANPPACTGSSATPPRRVQVTEVIYQAESPDEGALTVGAGEAGYKFFRRDGARVVIRDCSGAMAVAA